MRNVALAVISVLAFVSPTRASADEASKKIYFECQTGKLTGTYTQKQYSEALRNMQTDLEEYTDCADVIRRAQLSAAGRSKSVAPPNTGSTDAGGSAPPPVASSASGETAAQLVARATPGQRAALSAMRKGGSTSTLVGGKAFNTISSKPPAGVANRVPAPLAVALTLLGLGLAGAAANSLRHAIHSHRKANT